MTAVRIGRPRSGKARDAIVGATHALLNEVGGAGLTIEAIARRAGVGKPTVYRWWPSMADIVLEIVLNEADTGIAIPAYDTLPVTLGRFLRQSMRAITEWGEPHLRFLMAEAQRNEAFRERFRGGFAAKRQSALRSLLSEARRRGHIDSGCDLDLLVDLVFGAMWYRLLVGHAPLDQALADDLTRVVVAVSQTTRPAGTTIIC